MGAFYGSVHLRTQDTAAVRSGILALARGTKAKFFFAPPQDGWTAVYPNEWLDGGLAHAIAKRFDVVAVRVLLHDNAVFSYGIWRNGKLVDEYDSSPDHFGPIGLEAKKRTSGDPHLYADVLRDGVTADELKSRLTGNAHSQFTSFAQCLGLPTVQTSYDYLIEGDTDGVNHFDEFVHVPDLAKETAARAKKDASASARTRRLIRDGVLLCDLVIDTPDGMLPIPRVTVGPEERSFLYAITQCGSRGSSGQVFHVADPFETTPTEIAIKLERRPNRLLSSPSGRHLLIGNESGETSTDVWDLSNERLVATFPQTDGAEPMAFDAAEEAILTVSQRTQTLTIGSLTDGTVRTVLLDAFCRGACLHPANGTIVYGTADGGIVLIDSGAGLKRVRLAPPIISPEAQRAQRDAFLASAKGTAEVIAHQLAMFDAICPAAGLNHRNSICSCSFSRDGRLLISANEQSLRVFDWNAVKAATDRLPMPLHQVPAMLIEYKSGQFISTSLGPIYDAVHLPERESVLFCEYAGVVRSLDLRTGSVRELIRPPILGPIWQMQLSRDDSLLAVAYQPGHDHRKKMLPYRLQVWNIDRLF